MAHGVFRTVHAIMFSLPLVAIAYSEAPAQERTTCSQARSSCGKQPVCQRRYDACIETGCWTVGLVTCYRLTRVNHRACYFLDKTPAGTATPCASSWRMRPAA